MSVRMEDYRRSILKVLKCKQIHGYEAHKRLASEGIKVDQPLLQNFK